MIHRILTPCSREDGWGRGWNYRAFSLRTFCLRIFPLLALALLPRFAGAFDVLASATPPSAQSASSAQSAPSASSADTQTPSAVVQTEQVRAELLIDAPQGWQIGRSVRLGLKLTHSPHWHTYWRNSGDSGAPTTLTWQLPAGSSAGAIDWPMPSKIAVADMVNYGYEHEALLSVPITITQAAPADGKIILDAKWLVCRVECLPQQGHFELPIPSAPATAHASEFAHALQTVPPDAAHPPSLSATVEGSDLVLRSKGDALAAWRGQTVRVFAEEPDFIAHAAAGVQSWQGDAWQWRAPLNATVHTAPLLSTWVLSNGTQALRVQAQLTNPQALLQSPLYQRNTAGMQIPPALQAALARNAAAATPTTTSAPNQPNDSNTLQIQAPQTPQTSSALGLPWALLLALLGGMMLNLMPCVFPVLAIKVLSFVEAPDRRARQHSALAYALGLVLSFAVLAALLLALKAGGAALGWGFQLQSAWFLAALALLFTLLALNMSGGIQLRQFLPQKVLNATHRHPLVDSFLSGVLVVAIASPCTAPFMGAALGYALAHSAAAALSIFIALGLGMALPYVLLAYWPHFAQILPRPGHWMDAFKRLLALPLWLTVVWLLWVLGQQMGSNAAMLVLTGLVFFANILWLWFEKGYRKTAVFIGLLLLGCLWLFQTELADSFAPRISTSTAQTSSLINTASNTPSWQPWSPALQAQYQDQHQAVFVDYTAAWCVTCQYNKKAVLNQPAVLAAFAAHRVQLLQADWTRYDPAITQALQQLGRSGVPVYVLIDAQGHTQLLPELLSEARVLAALQGLDSAASPTSSIAPPIPPALPLK